MPGTSSLYDVDDRTGTRKWVEIQKSEGKSSLAKFVRDHINEYIAQCEVKVGRNIANGELKAQIAAQQEVVNDIRAKMDEFLTTNPETPTPTETEVAPRVISTLEIFGKPVKWGDIVKVLGIPKDAVLSTLEDLYSANWFK